MPGQESQNVVITVFFLIYTFVSLPSPVSTMQSWEKGRSKADLQPGVSLSSFHLPGERTASLNTSQSKVNKSFPKLDLTGKLARK